MRTHPTFSEEEVLWKQGYKTIAGIDEVGRGAFAGPLVTAAVVFPPNCTFSDPDLYQINDSKILSAKKRIFLADKIKSAALCWTICEVDVPYINDHGIGKAAQIGFYKASMTLTTSPDFHLIDAFYIDGINKAIQKPIIHGDNISFSIAAASIIAKVYRDKLMESLHEMQPEYDFHLHKGYGTKAHRDKIASHGLSSYHRSSFKLSSYVV